MLIPILRSLARRPSRAAIEIVLRLSALRAFPSGLRQSILRLVGVRNSGADIPSGVIFANRWVTLGAGSQICSGCRFEGAAPIIVEGGVVLTRPRTFSTRAFIGEHSSSVVIDTPLTVTRVLAKSGPPFTPVPGIHRPEAN